MAASSATIMRQGLETIGAGFNPSLLSPLASAVYGYWSAKRGGLVAPSRSDLDPVTEMPGLVSHMMLWRVSEASFICVLAGTAVCEAAGRELRGVSVESMHGDAPAQARREFTHVATTLQPHYVERQMHWVRKDYLYYTRLLLPLSSDQLQADMLLGVLDFI